MLTVASAFLKEIRSGASAEAGVGKRYVSDEIRSGASMEAGVGKNSIYTSEVI